MLRGKHLVILIWTIFYIIGMIGKDKWEIKYTRRGESVESSLIVETDDISKTLDLYSRDRDILFTSVTRL